MISPDEKPRILLVDDEHIIANTLKMIFSNAGMEAMAVYTAEQALALMSEWVPHIAIIDVNLPGMNGIDLAILIKARNPECGLTLFSGHTATADFLEKAQQDGFSLDVLAKPVHPADLLKRVTQQLAAQRDEPEGTA